MPNDGVLVRTLLLLRISQEIAMFKSYPIALSVLLIATAVAQTPAPTQPTETPSPSQPTSPAQPAGASKTMSDQTFVQKASAAGLAEVADAQKAGQMATRDDVRRAAQQLLTDHQAANAKLKTLAERKNLPLSTSPAPAPPAPTAGDFDSQYIAAQIKAHQAAVALFKSEVDGGRDNDLKAFATETLPTLEKHLAMMESLSKSK
jgi:putative membrane protein